MAVRPLTGERTASPSAPSVQDSGDADDPKGDSGGHRDDGQAAHAKIAPIQRDGYGLTAMIVPTKGVMMRAKPLLITAPVPTGASIGRVQAFAIRLALLTMTFQGCRPSEIGRGSTSRRRQADVHRNERREECCSCERASRTEEARIEGGLVDLVCGVAGPDLAGWDVADHNCPHANSRAFSNHDERLEKCSLAHPIATDKRDVAAD